jgi:hypothetical protein
MLRFTIVSNNPALYSYLPPTVDVQGGGSKGL